MKATSTTWSSLPYSTYSGRVMRSARGHGRVLRGQSLRRPARRGDVVHQPVGDVGVHDRLVVRELLRPHRVADVRSGQTTASALAPASLAGGTARPAARNGEERMSARTSGGRSSARRAQMSPPRLCPSRTTGLPGWQPAHLVEEHLGVVEVVVEPLDLPARAGRLAVAAQVVHVHRLAARGHRPRRTRRSGRRGRRTRGPRRSRPRARAAPSGPGRPAARPAGAGDSAGPHELGGRVPAGMRRAAGAGCRLRAHDVSS